MGDGGDGGGIVFCHLFLERQNLLGGILFERNALLFLRIAWVGKGRKECDVPVANHGALLVRGWKEG
jgi:hypothetical protein